MMFFKNWTMPDEIFVELQKIKYVKTTPKQEIFDSNSSKKIFAPGLSTYEVTLTFGPPQEADWFDNPCEMTFSCDTEEQMYDPRFKEGEWYFFTREPAKDDEFGQPQLRPVTMFEMLEIIVERDMKEN